MLSISFRPRIQGPLTMHPQTDDNFGVDACSLLVVPSNPPTVIIAEPSGNIFHGILLENDREDLDNVNLILSFCLV